MTSNGYDPVKGKTILAADDNPDNLMILGEMLKRSGFRVRMARDGEQALKSARAEKPHLILLDIHMPRMDGYDACRQIKADPAISDVPVVFISALSDPFNKEQAFAAGGFDYLEKPFRYEDVIIRVKNALLLGYYEKRCALLEKTLTDAGIAIPPTGTGDGESSSENAG